MMKQTGRIQVFAGHDAPQRGDWRRDDTSLAEFIPELEDSGGERIRARPHSQKARFLRLTAAGLEDGFPEPAPATIAAGNASTRHLDKNQLTLRLTPTLVVSIGILVLLSVGSVLIVNWFADRRIVQELTSRLITRLLAAEERTLRHHLGAAIDQGDYIAAAISSGRYRFDDPALTDFVRGTFAAAPQVDGVILVDGDGKALRIRLARVAYGREFEVDRFDIADDAQFAGLALVMRTRKQPYWGPPVYRPQRQETLLNYRVPIWSGDTYVGFAVVGISTRALVGAGQRFERTAPFDRLYAVRAGSGAGSSADGRRKRRSNRRAHRFRCCALSAIRSLKSAELAAARPDRHRAAGRRAGA